MPTTSVDGLGSNIKWNDIITAQVNADRSSTALMEKRKKTVDDRLNLMRTFNSKMLGARLDLPLIKNAATFQSNSVASSAVAVATATATTSALRGTTSIEVTQVAKAMQLATAGQLSPTASLGTGTLSIQVGSGVTTALTIDSSNNSLNGIASAINAAGGDVTASVVSESSTSFRLVLASKKSGADQSITLTDSLSAGGLGAQSVLTPAQNAKIKLGSGAGAIELQRSTNKITDIIPNVTLNVAGVGTTSITVGQDIDGAKTAVKALVTSMNGGIQFLTDNASYNGGTRKAGALFSESFLKSNMNDAIAALTGSVPGLSGAYASGASIGLGLDRSNGYITFDEAVFTTAMQADSNALGSLFSNTGTSSSPLVSFSTLNNKTKIDQPYGVVVTTAARQATTTGTSALAAIPNLTAATNTLQLMVNGTARTVTLTAGSYTPASLAAELQSRLTGVVGEAADRMSIALDGANKLVFTTGAFGSNTSFSITGGTAVSELGLSVGQGDSGVNVAGSFTRNGASIAAEGTGQVLTGAAGTDGEGLRAIVTANAGQLPGSGALATIQPRKGLAQRVGEAMDRLTDAATGALGQRIDGLKKTVEDMGIQISKADARMEIRRARYTRQFQAMEKSINSANSLGNFLNGQIKGFENAAKGN